MNMNLKIKRIYNLGNYSNVEFTEEVNDIPETLVFNKEVMYKLRKLMMLNVERSYRSYLELQNVDGEEQEQERDLMVEELDKFEKGEQ